MLSSTASIASLRLLLVEDSPSDADLLLLAVERAGYTIASAERVETAKQFVEQLSQPIDVILCDYSLPTFDALAALEILQESRRDIPFIIVSGSIGEEIAVQAIKSGADDYLLKDRLGRLGPAIDRALREQRLRLESEHSTEDLRQSEIKYRSLFEHLPDAAYLCNATSGRIFDTNPRGERLAGHDRSAILGLGVGDFLPPEVCQSLLAITGSTPAEIDCEFIRADGSKRSVRISATVTAISQRQLLLIFVREEHSPENRDGSG